MDTNETSEVQPQTDTTEAEVTEEVTPPQAPEKTEERPPETLEARRARLARELKQTEKKLGIGQEPALKKTDDVDYGQLAFYNTKSDSVKIDSDEDITFLKETIQETGKSQQALLGSKWFKSELKERQEARAVAKATPSANRTAGESATTKVDYWIAKGELPADPTLRIQVVNRKIELSKQGKL